MKKAAIAVAITLMGGAGSVGAQPGNTHSVRGVVAQCVHETRARGSYDIVSTEGVPLVAASYGGTRRGAQKVNDCLMDKYQVQPGHVVKTRTRTQVVTRSRAAVSDEICDRLMSRQPGEAFLLGAGASLLGGAIGAGIHAEVITQRFQACAARAGYSYTVSHGGLCGRGSSVLVGGTQYCLQR